MSQAAFAQALRPRHSALGLPGCALGHVITNVTRIHENKKSVSWPLARSEGHPPPDQCVGYLLANCAAPAGAEGPLRA